MPSLSQRIKDRVARLKGEDQNVEEVKKVEPVKEAKTETPKKRKLFSRKKKD